jgi:hypothetical protein
VIDGEDGDEPDADVAAEVDADEGSPGARVKRWLSIPARRYPQSCLSLAILSRTSSTPASDTMVGDPSS